MGSERTKEEQVKEILVLVMKDATYELKKSVSEWLLTRDETITRIEEIIEILHKTSKDVAISNTVGSSVSAVGGIVAIGCLIAAPFTAGVSLIPAAIAGGVTAGVGGATAIGSSIAGLVIDSKQVEQAQECIEKDRSHLKSLQTKLECYRNMQLVAINQIEQTVHPKSGSYKALDAGDAARRLGCNTGRVVATAIAAGNVVEATQTVSKTVTTAAAVGVRASALTVAHVFAAVGLGLDIAMIVFNGVKLGKGAKSDSGVKLEEAVKKLKDERDQFKKEYL